MKKVFMTLMLLGIFLAQASAQDIFGEVKKLMDGYQKVKNDTTQNLDVRKIATFKWDAIYYMVYKSSDETEQSLGVQVSAMIDYVNLYLQKLKNAKGKDNKALIAAKFKNATLENARYNDVDKEIIYAYVDNPDFLTQFSLDTDWVKALESVKK
jgi:uncharacterized protein YutE (UPF0331/DUF86 family)